MEQNQEPSIIYYGGAFDPPHAGHALCVRLVRQRFPKARILIAPSYVAPGLPGTPKNCEASFEDRMNMARLALQTPASGHDNGSVAVVDLEANLPTPSYTVLALEALRRQYPKVPLGLVMGYDQLRDFSRWQNPRRILELASLVIIKRGAGDPISLLEAAIAGPLGGQVSWDPGEQMGRIADLAARIFFVGGETTAASSTEIRRRVHNQEDLPAGWLSNSVKAYINQKNLYQRD